MRPTTSFPIYLALGAILTLAACKATETTSPARLSLVNQLYLEGQWDWSDSMVYSNYVPAGDSLPHRGVYVFAGTASLERVDSSTVETYVLDAVATLSHLDSVADMQSAVWIVPDLVLQDTVFIRRDTIFNLSIEPIPPVANATTDLIRWILNSRQQWCRNWLVDSVPAGNTESCQTFVRWSRTGR